MANSSGHNDGPGEPEYRVYHSGAGVKTRSAGGGGRGGSGQRPTYTTYRSQPRGLLARLRGENDADVLRRHERLALDGREPERRSWWRRWTWRRALKYVVLAVVAWVGLSLVLFLTSAQEHAGNLPAGADSQLSSSGPILTSANTVLILGLDNRPTTGPGSKEGGLQPYDFSEKDANTDTIMLWRIGGGVSRRLSIPRDTLVNIPGLGMAKINAAWSHGGPKLALRVIKRFTGLPINHLILVDLANFPKFIDDIGGVTVRTPRICSNISGGARQGGFTLNLRPGTHHLDGLQALLLARTRDNSCNPAYDDLNREAMQQQVLNGIKSQLFTAHAFFHLPWASWDAPGVIQTDMGGLSLLQLFAASEIGGSPPPALLKENGSVYNGADVLIPNQANVRAAVQKLLNG
jgi:LCP family protein required for cell wall assembly